jgi:hypothetical protein
VSCITDFQPVSSATAYFQVAGTFAGIGAAIIAIVTVLKRNSVTVGTILFLLFSVFSFGFVDALFGRIAGRTNATDATFCLRATGEMAVYGGLLANAALLLAGGIVSMVESYLRTNDESRRTQATTSETDATFERLLTKVLHRILPWITPATTLAVGLLVSIRTVDYLDIFYNIARSDARPSWTFWLLVSYSVTLTVVFAAFYRLNIVSIEKCLHVGAFGCLLTLVISVLYPTLSQYAPTTTRSVLYSDTMSVTVAVTLLLPVPAILLASAILKTALRHRNSSHDTYNIARSLTDRPDNPRNSVSRDRPVHSYQAPIQTRKPRSILGFCTSVLLSILLWTAANQIRKHHQK